MSHHSVAKQQVYPLEESRYSDEHDTIPSTTNQNREDFVRQPVSQSGGSFASFCGWIIASIGDHIFCIKN